MKIEDWDIEKLIPYARNPRKNSDTVDGLAASIKEFGFQQPIVVDVENVIVVGHTRYLAAKKLGLKKVPVHVAKELTPDQAKAYRIVDNKLQEKSKWDYELLQLELIELDVSSEVFQETFAQHELDMILQADWAPEVNKEPKAEESASIEQTHSVRFTQQQWNLVRETFKIIREREGESLTDGECLVFIAQGFLTIEGVE